MRQVKGARERKVRDGRRREGKGRKGRKGGREGGRREEIKEEGNEGNKSQRSANPMCHHRLTHTGYRNVESVTLPFYRATPPYSDSGRSRCYLTVMGNLSSEWARAPVRMFPPPASQAS